MTTGDPLEKVPGAGGLDELSPAECWELLATQPVGRVAVIVGHFPLVFPVNYAVVEKTILYRSGVGTKLHAIDRSNVTFEVDEIDAAHRSGWSVLIKGNAQELSRKRERQVISQAELGGASPWAAGEREHVVRIMAEQVTGRRIRALGLPPAPDWREWEWSQGIPGDLFDRRVGG